MGAFSGFKDATRGFNSNVLKGPGEYLVRIDASDFFDTENKGEKWKNTLTILGVISGDHHIGEVVNTFFGVSVGKKIFQQNLKGFIAGILQADDAEVSEGDIEQILGEDNPMAGMVATVKIVMRTSKTATDDATGDPVQYPTYSWGAALSNEEIEAALDEETMTKFFPNGLGEAE